MARLSGRLEGERAGAPPSVSMAVLCVVIPVMAVAAADRLLIASDGVLLLLILTLTIGPPVLWGASALLTVAYVLPTVALGHWLGSRAGHGKTWWWVTIGTALGLLPAVALPTMVRMSRSGMHTWWQLAMDGLLFAGVLWVAATPAALAVHVAVVREDGGRPVRPVVDILLWGSLGLLIEITALLAYQYH
ncbi:hypothetical protein AB0M42_07850 [Streptomyces sp. NPDC051784]|uniref:hypothetical protein n=1 Tax=Streptomyces sp. NPDC051784 TaxID=3155805 RepID=UPI0034384736